MSLPKLLKKFVFAGTLLAMHQISLAQSGAAYFADFQLSGRANQGQVTSMSQDAEGNMEIATSNGVVIYDGANTSLVGTGADIEKLEFVPENGKTYVGCDGRVGFISRNSSGKYIFTQIPVAGMENQSFSAITHMGTDVYFQSDEFVLKITGDKVAGKWNRPSEGGFSGMFVLANTVFVNVSTSGLYTLLPGGKLKKHAVDDSRLAEAYIWFAITRSKGELLLGTDASELLLFTGASLTPLGLEKQSYIQERVLTDGKKLDNNYMALSTLSGGLLVVNMYNGITSEVYNASTGFPDDKIPCIAVDNSHGIWTSHDLGLTRIDREIPVKYFSSYPGLHSRVTSLAESNGVLYAGCVDGLYLLKSADGAEYEQALKQAEKINKSNQENRKQGKVEKDETGTPTATDPDAGSGDNQTTPTQTTPDNTTTDQTQNPDEGNINNAGKKLKKLLEKAKRKVQGGSGSGSGGTKNPSDGNGGGEKSMGYMHPRNRIFQFASLGQSQSFQFIYTRIAGIDGRVKKMVTGPQGLYVATNLGLYLYSADGIKKLYEGEIRDITFGYGKIMFVSASDLNLLNNDGSVTTIQLKQNHRALGSVFIESNDAAWVGETNRATRVVFSNTGIVSKETVVEIPATFRDVVTVSKAGDAIFLVSSSGLYEFQPGTSTAVVSSRVQSDENEIFHYLINPSTNSLFIRTMEGWKEVISATEFKNVGLMDVINNLRYIFRSASGSIWAVGGSSNIYYLSGQRGASAASGFNVFIRGVVGSNGNLYDLEHVSISHRESEVEIKWGSNFFIQSGGTWYSWKIEGWKSDWSPWTRQTSRIFQLPPGRYKFKIRARDVYGNLSPEKTLSFTVDPPYWQTWWFYTLVATILGLGVWFIFRWRNRALIEKQKLLEKMVKERTFELAEEKEKTESLLLNILPKAVAQELKEVGQSSVRKHSDSAVMFTDFCDFTKLSKNMTAEELVLKLDNYFRKFDEIVEKYGLEKIKTIGDSYMCAAGVPQPKASSSLSIVMAALEILEVVENADTHWKIRVGIHQGGLVSGVVGKKKFAYDIWGDTVNVASRMESSSEPMNINITEQVYNSIKDYFDCEKRGEVEAKSLGKTSMYFVKGLKPQYRQNGSIHVPNKEFLALLN